VTGVILYKLLTYLICILCGFFSIYALTSNVQRYWTCAHI